MNKVGLLPLSGVMLSLELKQYYEPLRLPIRSMAFSFTLYATVDGLPTTAPGLQHWAINLQEHADPATPEVDECHFRYFSNHPTAFPF